MATVLKRKRQDGSLAWQVQIRVSGHRSVSKTFDNEADAKLFANMADRNANSAICRGDKLSERQFFDQSFSDVIREYEASGEALAWHKRTALAVLNHVGDVSMRDLRASWTVKYIRRMLNTQSKSGRLFKASTIGMHLTFMSMAYRWRALDFDITMPTDLFSSKHLPRGWEVCRDRRLARTEHVSLINYLKTTKGPSGPFWRILLNLAIETGARLQELVLAEWEEINHDTFIWTIPKEHTKSKVTRYVPLSHTACRLLRILQTLKSPNSSRLFHLFLNPTSVSVRFGRLIKKTGINDFRFHDLRHEAISRMVLYRRQVTPYEIMRIVGHSDIDMLNRYTNLRGDEVVPRFRNVLPANS